jgi:hypothetical protein
MNTHILLMNTPCSLLQSFSEGSWESPLHNENNSYWFKLYAVMRDCLVCVLDGTPDMYIVTCAGLAWLIIMGSGFDDRVHWHVFTITLNYNSSHIELLLNNVCLTNLWRITDWSLAFTNEIPFLTATLPEYMSPCRTVNCPLLFCLLWRECLC